MMPVVSAPETYVFFQISSQEAEKAFAFHQSLSDDHIWPRTKTEVERFIRDGELYGVKKQSSGEYVGLCYVHLDGAVWELGGITVSETVRGLWIGSVLTNLALAHTIAIQSPWSNKQEIIAHVHEQNESPRGMLDRAGFKLTGEKTIVPDEIARTVPSMKRNKDGKIVGDRFQFPQVEVMRLAKWLCDDFSGTLGDGVSQAVFENIGPGGLIALQAAIREAADELAPE